MSFLDFLVTAVAILISGPGVIMLLCLVIFSGPGVLDGLPDPADIKGDVTRED